MDILWAGMKLESWQKPAWGYRALKQQSEIQELCSLNYSMLFYSKVYMTLWTVGVVAVGGGDSPGYFQMIRREPYHNQEAQKLKVSRRQDWGFKNYFQYSKSIELTLFHASNLDRKEKQTYLLLTYAFWLPSWHTQIHEEKIKKSWLKHLKSVFLSVCSFVLK